MNLQSLRTKIQKGQTDFTKEVVVVVENQEHRILDIMQSSGKTLIITEPIAGINKAKAKRDKTVTLKDAIAEEDELKDVEAPLIKAEPEVDTKTKPKTTRKNKK